MRFLKSLIILVIIILLLSPVQFALGAPKDPKDDKDTKDDKQNQSDQDNKTNQGNQGTQDTPANQTTQTTQSNQGNQGNAAKDNKDKKDKLVKKTDEIVNKTFSGRFLNFSYNLTVDKLTNVSVYNFTLFNEIFIENGSFVQQKVSNHLFKGDGDGAKLIAHDNPICLIQIKANDNITIHLKNTDDWNNKTIDDKEVILVNDSIEVSLRLRGKPGSTFFKNPKYNLSVFLPKSSKLKIHIINLSKIKDKEEAPGMLWIEETKQIAFNAIYEESFAGDATITGLSQGPEADVYTYIEDFTFDVKDIDVDTQQITLQVSSSDPAGKFILLSSLKESLDLPLESYSDIQIFIDNDKVPEVEDPPLLSTSNAGYYRVSDNEAEQVLISIPYFSEHTITIKFIPDIGIGSSPGGIRPEKVWGYLDFIAIMVILLVIIIAGVYLYVDRRE